jgi:DNA-directed RNA polymerase subunit RPC12/RpoP
MKYCSNCGKELVFQENGLFNKLYKCSGCNKNFKTKKGWVKASGVLGTVLSVGGITWKLVNGEYVEAAQDIANRFTGNDDSTIG